MSIARTSLIAKLESAVIGASNVQRIKAQRRIIDPFLSNQRRLTAEQTGAFVDIVSRLAKLIEIRALAEPSELLAPIENAPPSVRRFWSVQQAAEKHFIVRRCGASEQAGDCTS